MESFVPPIHGYCLLRMCHHIVIELYPISTLTRYSDPIRTQEFRCLSNMAIYYVCTTGAVQARLTTGLMKPCTCTCYNECGIHVVRLLKNTVPNIAVESSQVKSTRRPSISFEVFRGFTPSLKVNVETVPQITPQKCPFTFLLQFITE
jgi:hypothetical protein